MVLPSGWCSTVVHRGSPSTVEARSRHDLDQKRGPVKSRLVTQRKESDRGRRSCPGCTTVRTTGTPLAMVVRQRRSELRGVRPPQGPVPARATPTTPMTPSTVSGTTEAAAGRRPGRPSVGSPPERWPASCWNGTDRESKSSAGSARYGTINAEVDPATIGDARPTSRQDPTRCPDHGGRGQAMTEAIEAGQKGRGFARRCCHRCCPPVFRLGLGEPVFDKLDADLAKAMLSLPAAKGFEIGSGFAGTLLTGRAHNDPFEPGPDGPRHHNKPTPAGSRVASQTAPTSLCRVAFKPTATIASEPRRPSTSTDGEPTDAGGQGSTRPVCSAACRSPG